MPIVIIAGEGERLIAVDAQSARLHDDIAQSTLHRVPGAGHMVHQTATGSVMAAIDAIRSSAAGGQTRDTHASDRSTCHPIQA